MSKEDPFENHFDDTEEKLKDPVEEQVYPHPIEQYEFNGEAEIIESEDLEKKKKKRKKIWLIVIFAIVLPLLLVVGIVVIIVIAILGLMGSCCDLCGDSCCNSCGESCNESCSSSCDNACQSSCDSSTCSCGSSINTISLKERIGTQMKLIQWYFKYISRIFKF